ncbi:hypothetical protein PDO_4470 [Rhizobium sp. PDO1-076]|uniref:hypothetical protein n=1 Tax=Rhizobium sp. PDO1-076 TaxID=1125979 RepID=UPI00024E2CA1|nr:hypothetical protein [Rhizobium sp. PDO1-076]EHS53008.1 hypothetical protein PDO_4470 [Rhizobium sp. PDO1-076]
MAKVKGAQVGLKKSADLNRLKKIQSFKGASAHIYKDLTLWNLPLTRTFEAQTSNARRIDMQTNTASQTKAPAVSATSSAPIPAHVLERLENEWRQMRASSSQPSTASK